MFSQDGTRLAEADELAQGPSVVGVAPQPGVERRAARHLPVGAAEEGRADEVARAGKFHALEGEYEQAQGAIDERVRRERPSERNVEGHRRLRRAGQVVA